MLHAADRWANEGSGHGLAASSEVVVKIHAGDQTRDVAGEPSVRVLADWDAGAAHEEAVAIVRQSHVHEPYSALGARLEMISHPPPGQAVAVDVEHPGRMTRSRI